MHNGTKPMFYVAIKVFQAKQLNTPSYDLVGVCTSNWILYREPSFVKHAGPLSEAPFEVRIHILHPMIGRNPHFACCLMFGDLNQSGNAHE